MFLNTIVVKKRFEKNSFYWEKILMKLSKKILIITVIITVILECAWYMWLGHKMEQLKRAYSQKTKQHQADRVNLANVPLPVLTDEQIAEQVNQWYSSTGAIEKVKIVLKEKGYKKPNMTYRYENHSSNSTRSWGAGYYEWLSTFENTKNNNLALNCIVNHTTGYYSFEMANLDVQGSKNYVLDMNLCLDLSSCDHAIYSPDETLVQILGKPPYLWSAIQFLMEISQSARAALANDNENFWPRLKMFLLSRGIEQNFSLQQEKHQLSIQTIQTKQQEYKTRLPWYGLLLWVCILVSKGRTIARISKSLIGGLFSFKKDPTLDALKVKLLRTQTEIAELTSLNRQRFKEAESEADKKIRAEKERLSKKHTEKMKDININLISQYYKALTDSEKPDFISELVRDCQIPLKNQYNALQDEIVKLLASVTILQQGKLSKAQRATVNSVQAQLQNLQNSEEFMKKQLKDFTKKLEALERATATHSMINEIDSLLEQIKDHVEFFQKLQKLKNKLVQKGISLNSQNEFQLLKKTIERSKMNVG